MPEDVPCFARRHSLTWDGPNPDFFEGMLLGNGDLGVCVTVRPDAIVLHLGKTDTWDIRHSEEFIKDLKPFSEFVAMVRRISERVKREGQEKKESAEDDRPFQEKHVVTDGISEQLSRERPDEIDWINGVEHDPEYRAYVDRMRAGYSKPWPRPWPCGQVFLHVDPRRVSVDTQRLDISTGLLRIRLVVDGVEQTVSCFVHRDCNLVWLWTTDPFGRPAALPVRDVTVRPHRDPATGMPEPSPWQEVGEGVHRFGFDQRLPITPPTSDPPEVAPVAEGDQSFSCA
ncbi:MAG: hypothetical protein HY710_04950, partial [Candidatus Latescibacteria bacterium]|nr:hypothetical protein [Candidatus Latescibacterota bacterium]